MSNDLNLLPCPFCGAALRVNNANLAAHPRHSDCMLAQHVVVMDSPAQIESWNCRAQPADTPAPVQEHAAPSDERESFEAWLADEVDQSAIGYGTNELTLARAAWAYRGRHGAQPAASAEPDGWKLVPIKPTEEMHDAWCASNGYWDDGWKAAVLAAPVAAQAPAMTWPTMPPSKGQSHVLFEDGYAEGWAKCLDQCKAMFAAQAQQDAELTRAARDVLAERQRQITAEGWSPDHDNEHNGGELCAAAAAYALHASDHLHPESQGDGGDDAPSCWPWHNYVSGRGEGPEPTRPAWWKPGTPRRNLEKAGALILAEIERLDRAARAAGGEQA